MAESKETVEAGPVRLVLVDDHLLVRKGVRALLEAGGRARVVAEASSVSEALEAVSRVECDYVVMDMQLPDGSGIDCTQEIARRHPGLPVLMLSMHTDGETVDRALRMGARAYLPKDTSLEEVFDAFRAIQAGDYYLHPKVVSALLSHRASPARTTRPHGVLTEREREVLTAVIQGKTYRRIGDELFVAECTVKSHVQNMFDKFGVSNRAELLFKVLSEKILEQP